jgi:hypothetical protein
MQLPEAHHQEGMRLTESDGLLFWLA